MGMKVSIQSMLLALAIAFLGSICEGQSHSPKYDPGQLNHSRSTSRGFLDFTLGRINAGDKDYGECLSEGRRFLLEETVKNGYFWSNVTALGLLSVLLIVIIHQRKVLADREWSTTQVLAQFQHALQRNRDQLVTAAKKNRELAELLAITRESAMRTTSLTIPIADRTETVLAEPRASATSSSVATNPVDIKKGGNQLQMSGNSVPLTSQMKLFTPELDLVMKVNSLEQQLAHTQRDNDALRRKMSNAVATGQSEKPVKRPPSGTL
jgi:hypothetical protein